jgi:hypothetical protein
MLCVQTYLKESRDSRRSHLDLKSDCIERGGNSTNHRGVLAQYLDTQIFGKPADLCHACHNPNCSNPKHLYWGTRSDNVQDAKDNGTFKSPWDNKVEKYGYEEACRMNSRGDKSVGGKANKGKPKKEEHKKNISNSLKKGLTDTKKVL